jgi:hypothetical protein
VLELLPHELRHRLEVLAGALDGSVEVRISEADLTRLTPTEYRADLVLEFGNPVRLALIVEVQLSRDPDKRAAWPMYTVGLYTKLRCPVVLVVVAVTDVVARWCAQPILLGHPGLVLRPVVVGPDLIPLVDDAVVARGEPELLVLSAMAHGRGPHGMRLAKTAAESLVSIAPERARLYTDLVLMHLGEAAKSWLEKTMDVANYQVQSEFLKRLEAEASERGLQRGLQQGLQQGLLDERSQAVLEVLRARGLDVTQEVEEGLKSVRDLDRLAELLRRAVTVKDARELLG